MGATERPGRRTGHRVLGRSQKACWACVVRARVRLPSATRCARAERRIRPNDEGQSVSSLSSRWPARSEDALEVNSVSVRFGRGGSRTSRYESMPGVTGDRPERRRQDNTVQRRERSAASESRRGVHRWARRHPPRSHRRPPGWPDLPAPELFGTLSASTTCASASRRHGVRCRRARHRREVARTRRRPCRRDTQVMLRPARHASSSWRGPVDQPKVCCSTNHARALTIRRARRSRPAPRPRQEGGPSCWSSTTRPVLKICDQSTCSTSARSSPQAARGDRADPASSAYLGHWTRRNRAPQLMRATILRRAGVRFEGVRAFTGGSRPSTG